MHNIINLDDNPVLVLCGQPHVPAPLTQEGIEIQWQAVIEPLQIPAPVPAPVPQ